MKIQLNTNAPMFCANFAKDRETKMILKGATTESEHSYMPIYDTVNELKNLKAKDTISITKPSKNTFVIKNNTTGATSTIVYNRRNALYYYDNNFDEGVEYLSTAIKGALFDYDNAQKMFSADTRINTAEPSYYEKREIMAKKSKTKMLEKQLAAVNKEHVRLVEKLIEYREKLKKNTEMMDNLNEQKLAKERNYTLSLIG